MKMNKKIIILILIIIFLAAIALVMVFNKNNKPIGNKEEKNNVSVKEEKNVYDIDVKDIKNFKAKIVSVDVGEIKVTTGNGEEGILKIPKEGANFVRQVKKDNEIIEEKINLFDLPKDKEVNIQYDIKTNEVLLIIVN